MAGYEAKVWDDGDELTVIEAAQEDSGDPDTIKLVVYAWRKDDSCGES